MPRINSRRKGARGELELAEWLRDHGVSARRGQQFSGSVDSPDVVHDIPGVHIEAKRCERTDLYAWLAQAKADAGDKLAIVAHRKNRQDWIAIMSLENLLALLQQRKGAC